jgi:hypothetical protein
MVDFLCDVIGEDSVLDVDVRVQNVHQVCSRPVVNEARIFDD